MLLEDDDLGLELAHLLLAALSVRLGLAGLAFRLVQLFLQALLVGLQVPNGQQLLFELAARLSNLVLEAHNVLVELLLFTEQRLDLLLLLLARLLELCALPADALKVTNLALQLLILEHERLHATLVDGLGVGLAFLDHARHLLEVCHELLVLVLLLFHLHLERLIFFLGLEHLVLELYVLGAYDFLVAGP